MLRIDIARVKTDRLEVQQIYHRVKYKYGTHKYSENAVKIYQNVYLKLI